MDCAWLIVTGAPDNTQFGIDLLGKYLNKKKIIISYLKTKLNFQKLRLQMNLEDSSSFHMVHISCTVHRQTNSGIRPSDEVDFYIFSNLAKY